MFYSLYGIYDGTMNVTVAVGEQGAALPQASLFKGGFRGIVNISLIMIMKNFHNHNYLG